jgi:hypothetical protein
MIEKGVPYQFLFDTFQYSETSKTGIIWKNRSWNIKQTNFDYLKGKAAGSLYFNKKNKTQYYFVCLRYNNIMKKISCSRIIMILHGFFPDGSFNKDYDITKKFVSHKDGNTCNNNISNLFIRENGTKYRTKATLKSKTGVQGVFWEKRLQKFRVCLTYKGRKMYYGCYDTIDEARLAAKEKRILY